MIGYNKEICSYRIITTTGGTIDTKSIKFLDFEKLDSTFIEDEELIIPEILEETPLESLESHVEQADAKILSIHNLEIDDVNEPDQDSEEQPKPKEESSYEDNDIAKNLIPAWNSLSAGVSYVTNGCKARRCEAENRTTP
ncbi:hypothetical protein Pst134EA_015940 [Puccinia striiformis f. sp. tritici]|uniref:hypothetical protein n=1 Tax=Puccinia striiformis f. sp. tritici TaxID=168172 RepID=UPI0020078934|nr:hypothetical protein Pst134EA_015940 [Puccinia striiformis f. sp. tritici]KAH9463860.1 hypothetical protein Pst134EA_015940 [Puccinia striiformis f. sp. tritici]KAI9605342.1 hypothetical protein KEM48_002282 [Puccinia striiformis f. sp. tritici PST-130]